MAPSIAEARAQLLVRLVLSVALSVFAGCMLFEALAPEAKGLVFSHGLHVQEEGLACLNCHEDTAVASEPGMPALDTCTLCHVDLDEGKPLDRRIEVLFDGDTFRATRISALDDEIVFDHLAHVETIEECSLCHTEIESTNSIDERLAVRMDACVRCHEAQEVPGNCSTCHSEIGTDWAPDSHHHNWQKLHGQACRRSDPPLVDQCSLCHTESTCVQCHMVQPPENHNGFFRLRGHAVLARVDRRTCATCHEPATCDRCHAETLPLNHTGLFATPRNTHCFACHFPLQASGCVTCHKNTASHDLGPPKPSWHNPAMNCRQCHGQPGLPLSHVDNGSNCNLCHP